jgi:hypothetical protein
VLSLPSQAVSAVDRPLSAACRGTRPKAEPAGAIRLEEPGAPTALLKFSTQFSQWVRRQAPTFSWATKSLEAARSGPIRSGLHDPAGPADPATCNPPGLPGNSALQPCHVEILAAIVINTGLGRCTSYPLYCNYSCRLSTQSEPAWMIAVGLRQLKNRSDNSKPIRGGANSPQPFMSGSSGEVQKNTSIGNRGSHLSCAPKIVGRVGKPKRLFPPSIRSPLQRNPTGRIS